MSTKQPADAIPDDLILAAIDRAERHRTRKGVPDWSILDHLGISRRSGKARQVRGRLAALTESGHIERSRAHGVVIWTMTPKGRLRRAGEIADQLPESPQHQLWRNARTVAEHEIERFQADLHDALEQATDMLDDMTVPISPGAVSDAWFELGERLRSTCRRLGAARHCLYEWEEPDDERPDADDRTDPSDAAFGEQERNRRQARRAGRRNILLWSNDTD
ncbi:MAG: hypothetical protein ACLPUT_17380 [Solirubrobacteraceae bacterium]